MVHRPTLVQIVLVLVSCGLAGCPKSSANLKYAATGDALYDRFAKLVLNELDEAWSATANNGDRTGYKLDFSDVITWESEYSDDANYWQLRAFVDSYENREELMNVYAADSPPYINELLIRKIEGGFTDRGCFAALPWASLSEGDPKLGLKLINEAILKDADNSYFYYIKATFLGQSGDFGGAKSAVHDGNRAPRNDWVFSFPYNKVLDNPSQVKFGGAEAVAGFLQSEYIAPLLTERIFEKYLIRKLTENASLTPSDIDELIIAAQRLGTKKPDLMLEPLNTLVYLGSIERAIPKQSFYLNPGQTRELEELFAITDGIMNEMNDHFVVLNPDGSMKFPDEQNKPKSGRQWAQQNWAYWLETNEFMNSIYPKLDPFIDPPLGSWFPSNKTP